MGFADVGPIPQQGILHHTHAQTELGVLVSGRASVQSLHSRLSPERYSRMKTIRVPVRVEEHGSVGLGMSPLKHFLGEYYPLWLSYQ
jgi:hypothetical protein